MRTVCLLSFFVLFSLTIGCDGDGTLKPGEFEDPAFAKCVEKNLQDYYNNHLIDSSDPEKYNKVKMLECYGGGGGGVSGLKGIENMPNIDDLAIVDNEIESLEPLRTLTKLEFLKLSNNKIKDLEPLSGL
ncbi:MAG TPA: hypothetical protein P5077_13235, partial [bacterium]|nr:hypothetical protein [bacterium]